MKHRNTRGVGEWCCAPYRRNTTTTTGSRQFTTRNATPAVTR